MWWDSVDQEALNQVRKDIDSARRKLMRRAVGLGHTWEYFGQKEARALYDKYGRHGPGPIFAEIVKFQEWAEDYTPIKGVFS